MSITASNWRCTPDQTHATSKFADEAKYHQQLYIIWAKKLMMNHMRTPRPKSKLYMKNIMSTIVLKSHVVMMAIIGTITMAASTMKCFVVFYW